ncbi:LamG domain-containing protein [Thermophagus sp. OGC60D27]|uniref:LamG domain-containing protein n=1 Tax=Thermophagus sp. OGC60D27 TaxID=3458415 RepID=UPI0040377A26
MKTLKLIFASLLVLSFFNACDQQYIDDISKVEPGEDESAPQVIVNFPPEGYELQTNDAVASITFDFEVSDDIEIASVVLEMDGSEMASFTSFKDYRVFMEKYTYDEVTTGSHVFTIKATDLNGETTVVNINFKKSPPYVSEYEGEVFYMAFNNEYREMNTLSLATVVGNPGFAEGIQGGTAYQGATDSYLTFPTSLLEGATAVSASFWLKIDASAERAGILVVAPPADNNNDRTKGFRLFRESSNSGATQRFKLNVGTGDSDSWYDGGTAADVEVNTGDWVHIAFSISETRAALYINGETVSEGAFDGIDWTGCDLISIMSGAPYWTEWGHLSDGSQMDELRIFNKALTQDEIRTIMLKEEASFYMDFNGDYQDAVSGADATVVGNPSFEYGAGVTGDAYKGAADSYLTFSAEDLNIQSEEFSASFWLNINDDASRAGILVMGPEDAANPDAQNDRTSGFRFFREATNDGATQRFKLNAGNGTADSWFDGGEAADVTPNTGEWVHFAFVISNSEARVFINGVEVSQGVFDGIDWNGCDLLSIMSGSPRFNGWGHTSDQSWMDELYMFPKALTADEVGLLMSDGI